MECFAVAKVSAVREELVAPQKAVARTRKIVMIGRDIGTVVLPNADLKIYLNASAGKFVLKALARNESRGENRDLNSILDETLARDRIDSDREDSPLRPAKDAWELNTDDLDIQQVIHQIVDRVKTL
ncbi:MAG: hypothetical protein CM1200mP27_05380 [Chloroflexota bacterium]|nr:MAG: hypothetical protein CM1200mP27_05380 [Chloroflexota bacterium]